MGIARNDRFRRPSLKLRRKHKFKIERVGVAVVPKKQHMLDVNLFAQYILNGKISHRDHPPMCIEQPSPKAALLTDTDIQFEDIESRDVEENSLDGKSGSSLGSREIMSYTELYSPNIGLNNEHLTNINLIDVVKAKQKESGTYDTISPNKDCFMEMSRSPSSVHNELQNNFLLCVPDCGNNFFCDDDEGVGKSLDKVSPNWYLPSCLDTASKVFKN